LPDAKRVLELYRGPLLEPLQELRSQVALHLVEGGPWRGLRAYHVGGLALHERPLESYLLGRQERLDTLVVLVPQILALPVERVVGPVLLFQPGKGYLAGPVDAKHEDDLIL